jgi:hypothetical protein
MNDTFESLDNEVERHGRQKPVVDLQRLRESIDKPSTFVPKALPGSPAKSGESQYTALQLIGHAATRLTWRDAEKMGQAIQAKMKDGGSLTAAIQAWAEDWEKFE